MLLDDLVGSGSCRRRKPARSGPAGCLRCGGNINNEELSQRLLHLGVEAIDRCGLLSAVEKEANYDLIRVLMVATQQGQMRG